MTWLRRNHIHTSHNHILRVSFLPSSLINNIFTSPWRVTSFQFETVCFHRQTPGWSFTSWRETPFFALTVSGFLIVPVTLVVIRLGEPLPTCLTSSVHGQWVGWALCWFQFHHGSAVSLPTAVGTSPSPFTGPLWGSVLLVAPISQLILRGNLTNPNMLCSYQLVDAGSVPHASLCNGAIIAYALIWRGTRWSAMNAAY